MAFSIKDVFVDKISLISRGKRPAVPKAETTFSIFKMVFGDDKPKLSAENLTKLENISKKYDKKTLYVSRGVTNAKKILKWAEDQGIMDLLTPEEMHTTIAFSRKKVAWEDFTPDTNGIEITLENASIEKLGDAIVIMFESKDLEKGWKKYIDGGASWDYEGYMPHISLSYNADQDISAVSTFSGKVSFGAEVFDEIKKELMRKLERISKRYHKAVQ